VPRASVAAADSPRVWRRRSRTAAAEASDGNRFAAYSAATEVPDAPGVVILPDVRGLHAFYEEMAPSVPNYLLRGCPAPRPCNKQGLPPSSSR
jgi:hypothetical protein